MNSSQILDIQYLSKHLFWDIDVSQLDSERNQKTIITRVLDYGLLSDWNIIKELYGIETIVSVALNARDLDPKSMAYISALSNIPFNRFKCYISTQSIPKHWNF